jgi:K+ transporter
MRLFTLTHLLSLTLSHTHTRALAISMLPHTHTHTLIYTHAHTHTFIYVHTHTCALTTQMHRWHRRYCRRSSFQAVWEARQCARVTISMSASLTHKRTLHKQIIFHNCVRVYTHILLTHAHAYTYTHTAHKHTHRYTGLSLCWIKLNSPLRRICIDMVEHRYV